MSATDGGATITSEDLLERLFKDSGVRAVFSSRDHIYYRTRRGGITYINRFDSE